MTFLILPEHRQLLEVLSMGTITLGECHGAALWRLLGEGYAAIEPVKDGERWPCAIVSLTPKGFRAAMAPNY